MLKFAKTTRENFDALEGRYETGKVYFISDEGTMFLDGKLYFEGDSSSAIASIPEKICHREELSPFIINFRGRSKLRV